MKRRLFISAVAAGIGATALPLFAGHVNADTSRVEFNAGMVTFHHRGAGLKLFRGESISLHLGLSDANGMIRGFRVIDDGNEVFRSTGLQISKTVSFEITFTIDSDGSVK